MLRETICSGLEDFTPLWIAYAADFGPPRPSRPRVKAVQDIRYPVGGDMPNHVATFGKRSTGGKRSAGDSIPDENAKYQCCCQPKPSSRFHSRLAFRLVSNCLPPSVVPGFPTGIPVVMSACSRRITYTTPRNAKSNPLCKVFTQASCAPEASAGGRPWIRLFLACSLRSHSPPASRTR